MEVVKGLMASKFGCILVTCIVAGLWMTVSSGLIFLNKWIMSADKFEYPMFLAGLGMLFSGCASFVCCRVRCLTIPPPYAHTCWQLIKVIEAKKTISWHFYITRILPVGLFMAMTLAFGNLVYLYLGVAFIQMLKVRGTRLYLNLDHTHCCRRLRP